MSTLDNLLDLQDQICYVKCGFCSTILLVSVPCSSLSMVVTVKCGHCTRILSVNMMTARLVPLHLFSSLSHQEHTVQPKREVCSEEVLADKKAAIGCFPPLSFSSDEEVDEDSNQVIHKPPEKKQRAPSAYNHFIKEEIKRLKIEYPNMTHKQAFSAAAKNWAHCPQSQYRGGEVHGYAGEPDRNLAMAKQSTEDVVCNEVHCFGNGFHDTKALKQCICRKPRF
ncbi:UNVERIFIED_CONTAM: Axial regulator YABBY 4 [Sesamum calycinum]|uniref:Axial regulator YABBY 4 n=1 Tax=Sesamum calycinum TaxID=2727403 RepID=A0AAW2PQ46_9LAMI